MMHPRGRCSGYRLRLSTLVPRYICAANGQVIDGLETSKGRGKNLKIDDLESTQFSLLRIYKMADVTIHTPRIWTEGNVNCARLTIKATITDAPLYRPILDGMDTYD